MIVKKTGKQITGAVLTVAEQKAMDIEILKQVAVLNEQNETEVDAIILWILHEEFGFGPKKLKQFYDRFTTHYTALIERYEMNKGDYPWLCTQKLKSIGADIESWRDEKNV